MTAYQYLVDQLIEAGCDKTSAEAKLGLSVTNTQQYIGVFHISLDRYDWENALYLLGIEKPTISQIEAYRECVIPAICADW